MSDDNKDDARPGDRNAARDVKTPDSARKKDEDPDEPKSGVNRDE